MTGTPEGSTESGFMEKPGIEPGLQGIALIHYTTPVTYRWKHVQTAKTNDEMPHNMQNAACQHNLHCLLR